MSCVLATAGHVDHGKSSLVRALTGIEPDRFVEEQRRGLTIDLGFAHTTLESGAVLSFIDVPGHVRFLPNMLAGVGGVRACLFVVAAPEGWKRQSEEHLRILEMVGVEHAVVALTKADLVDEDTLELRRLELAESVANTFLSSAPVVAVSATTGAGVDELRAELDALIGRTRAPADRRWPRLWVDRSFAAKGSGTVVTGTLLDGSLSAGDEVVLEPGTRPARVRAIQSHSLGVDRIGPGSRVALNLSGIAHHDVRRGDVVITDGQWHLTDRFDASLAVLAGLDHDVSRRGAYLAYIGSAELAIRVRVLGNEAIAPGASSTVRIYLPRRIPLLPGDRFVVRESGRDETVGGGIVLDVDPIMRASRAAPDGSVARAVAERGAIAVDQLERLTGVRVPPTAGRWVFSDEWLAATTARLDSALADVGESGIELVSLDDMARAVIAQLDGVVVDAGYARRGGNTAPYADHPLVDQLRSGGMTPAQPDNVDRRAVRELVRLSVLFERDGLLFHTDAIGAATAIASELLELDPNGFTVSAFRQRSDTTRKYAVPLLAELDARGITRRRADLRIAGPRLTR